MWSHHEMMRMVLQEYKGAWLIDRTCLVLLVLLQRIMGPCLSQMTVSCCPRREGSSLDTLTVLGSHKDELIPLANDSSLMGILSEGQYSVVRAIDDDDDPPVLPYNPEGEHEYSELWREGEKRKKQQQQQQGAAPLYASLNQDDDTSPVPPYKPEECLEPRRREIQPTDPSHAIPTIKYTPAAYSTVRTLPEGDEPPSYPPPLLPIIGQYSVVRAIDNDDDPPVLPYNPEGVHKYSEHAVERRRDTTY